MKFILIIAGVMALGFVIMTIVAKGRRARDAEEKVKQPQPKIASATPLPSIPNVIRGCAALMEKTDPLTFYDERMLPCPKDLAEKSVIAAIGMSPVEQQQQLLVMLEWLTQFHAGIGAVPLSRMMPDFASKMAAAKSDMAALREVAKEGTAYDAANRERWEAFNKRAESDRARYRTLYQATPASASNT